MKIIRIQMQHVPVCMEIIDEIEKCVGEMLGDYL